MSTSIHNEDLTEVAVVASGHMGVEADWCWWDAEYPDEGSCGPFSTREEAIADAKAEGFDVVEDEVQP